MVEESDVKEADVEIEEEKELELPEEPSARMIYEQDLRATSHSNGRFTDLVGSSVDGPPPESPEDDSHFHGDRGKSPKGLRYMLATTYLIAGVVAFYVGITMIRELRKEK